MSAEQCRGQIAEGDGSWSALQPRSAAGQTVDQHLLSEDESVRSAAPLLSGKESIPAATWWHTDFCILEVVFCLFFYYCARSGMPNSQSHPVVSLSGEMVTLLKPLNPDVVWLTARSFSYVNSRTCRCTIAIRGMVLPLIPGAAVSRSGAASYQLSLPASDAKFSVLYLWRVSSTVVPLDIWWNGKLIPTQPGRCRIAENYIPPPPPRCDYSLGHVHHDGAPEKSRINRPILG